MVFFRKDTFTKDDVKSFVRLVTVTWFDAAPAFDPVILGLSVSTSDG